MTCLGRGDGTPLTWALSEPEMDEGVNDPKNPLTLVMGSVKYEDYSISS